MQILERKVAVPWYATGVHSSVKIQVQELSASETGCKCAFRAVKVFVSAIALMAYSYLIIRGGRESIKIMYECRIKPKYVPLIAVPLFFSFELLGYSIGFLFVVVVSTNLSIKIITFCCSGCKHPLPY